MATIHFHPTAEVTAYDNAVAEREVLRHACADTFLADMKSKTTNRSLIVVAPVTIGTTKALRTLRVLRDSWYYYLDTPGSDTGARITIPR